MLKIKGINFIEILIILFYFLIGICCNHVPEWEIFFMYSCTCIQIDMYDMIIFRYIDEEIISMNLKEARLACEIQDNTQHENMHCLRELKLS